MIATSPRKAKVLLVEDEDDVRRSLQLLLSSHHYEVSAYASAVGLAKNPTALQADCLVADLVMPVTGAFELLDAMRRAGWAGKSVLISGFPAEDWRDQAVEAGFDAALSKPIAHSRLIRTIAGLLENAAKKSEASRL